MATDWEDVLLAYLHDPPDKALAIAGHVERAGRYLAEALGKPLVERKDLKTASDPIAARAERVPSPHWQTLTVPVVDDQLMVYHPLAGTAEFLAVGKVDEAFVLTKIREIVSVVGDDLRFRFLAIWRLLAERLAAERREFAQLPADTRIPDHTIWHHLDITAGLAAADQGGRGRAFLSFSLGPVQSFIAGARTVRDLWSGSMILSYLTFQAMLPVIREYGPTALVYPALRGVPLLDLWLRDEGLEQVPEPETELRKAPCLPNRFLAVVPWGPDGEIVRSLAGKCEQAARGAWQKMANAVRSALDPTLGQLDPNWVRRWDDQVGSFFEFRTAVLPWWDCKEEQIAALRGAESFATAYPEAEAVRQLATAIPEQQRPGYQQNQAGEWQARVDLSARLMEAIRSVRHVSRYQVKPPVPPKCSLMGTYEQVGPDGLDDSRRFWEEAGRQVSMNGVRLRERERLCAVALVKRFSAPCFLAGELDFSAEEARTELRFDDTATVAAERWLKEARAKGFDWLEPRRVRDEHENWSGQWLHWSCKDFDPEDRCPDEVWKQIERARQERDRGGCGKPPAYYAILMLDGDDLGGWLSGKNSPRLREIIHPDLRRYFESLPNTREGLEAHRPVGPALHAALSTALANFALHVVPQVVRDHSGTLIYSGGDDTLALLPARTAVSCARELQKAYQLPELGQNDRLGLLMGAQATLSGGLAIVHYKEDLRTALDAARKAEKAAKKAGKNALQIAVCRRSGEHSSALCPWDFVDGVIRWVQEFENRASDRWAYHLAADRDTLGALDAEAIRAEIGRQVGRAEERTRAAFRGVLDDWEHYRTLLTGRALGLADLLVHFVTLVESASFLARGRDQ